MRRGMGDDPPSRSWDGAFGPSASPAAHMSVAHISGAHMPVGPYQPKRGREPVGGSELHVEIPHVVSAVDLVQELATQRWRRTAAQRLADHLGEEVWQEAGRDWLPSHCKKLAKAAWNLAALDPGLSGFDSVLGRQRIKDAVKRTRVGAALVDRVTAADTPVASVVAAMRVSGIILCELHGCVATCQSLRDLARETAPDLLRSTIDEVCDGYLTGGAG